MKITKIIIRNFRSIENAEIEPSEFNVLVGQNNHGKTNTLEAIDWFYNDSGAYEQIHRKGSGSDSILVEITFDDVKSGLEKMKNEKNRATIEKKLGDAKTITIRRIIDPGESKKSERKIFDTETKDYISHGTGFDKALNDLLPTLEFVKTDLSAKDVVKYGRTTQIGKMLGQVVNEILAGGDERYEKFLAEFIELFQDSDSVVSTRLKEISSKVKGYIVKQFPDCKEVLFDVKSPEFGDLLKNFNASIDDGTMTDASEKGDGMQRALMLAIIQTYADYRRDNESIKNFVFMIDEAELHLHPTAQRALKDALIELSSNGDQFFVTTHSSVLISDEVDMDGVEQSIFKVEKIDSISQIAIQAKQDKQDLIYDLLGGNPADLLMPRNFLIVEGESEYRFINNVIKRFYPAKKEIKIIKAFGDIDRAGKAIDAIEKVFTPLSESLYAKKTIILMDSLKTDAMKASFNEFKAKFSQLMDIESQVVFLPTDTIEEYYPEAEARQIREPNDHLYVPKWKRTKEEALQMKGYQKLKLSLSVSTGIEPSQFETEMAIIKDALDKCWANAY